jgi:hypothetical protein
MQESIIETTWTFFSDLKALDLPPHTFAKYSNIKLDNILSSGFRIIRNKKTDMKEQTF